MAINSLDMGIVRLLKNKPAGMSTTQLAKAIFNPENRWELRSKDSIIRRHLQKLCNYRLVKENVVLSGYALYTIDLSKIVNSSELKGQFLRFEMDKVVSFVNL